MADWRDLLGTAARALSLLLGGGTLLLALGTVLTSRPAGSLLLDAVEVLSLSFSLLLAMLSTASLFAWLRLAAAPDATAAAFWHKAGLAAASGIATLALTYTLLGISLGISGLSGQPLTPEAVPGVIADLTGHFGMAFMTTVVGLPLSTALRALLLLTAARRGDGQDNKGL